MAELRCPFRTSVGFGEQMPGCHLGDGEFLREIGDRDPQRVRTDVFERQLEDVPSGWLRWQGSLDGDAKRVGQTG